MRVEGSSDSARRVERASIYGDAAGSRFVDRLVSVLRPQGIEYSVESPRAYPTPGTLKGSNCDLFAIDLSDPSNLAEIRSKNWHPKGLFTEFTSSEKVPVFSLSNVELLQERLKDNIIQAPDWIYLVIAAYSVAAESREVERVIHGWTTTTDQAALPFLPSEFELKALLSQELRYGENPQQRAALYITNKTYPGVATAEQLQGKELSYNNINDAHAAFELISEFDPSQQAAIAIIKHANPCGVSSRTRLANAFDRALACDPVSAFGGVIASNRPIDAASAEKISKVFAEVVIAPAIHDDARRLLQRKSNLRLLVTNGLPDPRLALREFRSVGGGCLVQTKDTGDVELTPGNFTIPTKIKPTEQQWADLKFAFKVCKHVKSNAVVYAKDRATVGVGAGQMSRVDAAKLGAWKAEEVAKHANVRCPIRGSVAASDAFFPFADGIKVIANAGAKAVIQPGGSMRDEEVITAADEAGLAMVFTHMRHFRH